MGEPDEKERREKIKVTIDLFPKRHDITFIDRNKTLRFIGIYARGWLRKLTKEQLIDHIEYDLYEFMESWAQA